MLSLLNYSELLFSELNAESNSSVCNMQTHYKGIREWKTSSKKLSKTRVKTHTNQNYINLLGLTQLLSLRFLRRL